MLKNSLDNFVMSTRIRLARNIEGIRFEPMISPREGDMLLREIGDVLARDAGLTVRPLRNMTENEMLALKEQHLISDNLIARRDTAGVAVSPDSSVAVMINEEDHIRLQCIYEGLELESAYTVSRRIDDLLANSFRYAYDDRLGYLTTCPTNLGTGMRASVMMFLPGIHLTGGIADLTISGMLETMTFRGVYGEGSEAEGFLYQLSNKHTLGMSEQEIIADVKYGINYIAEFEERAREKLYRDNRVLLTDKVYRSWGALTNSYTMSSGESVELIAFVKLGVSLGLLRLTDPRVLDRLLTECRPATLTQGRDCDQVERDILRAERLRNALSGLRI